MKIITKPSSFEEIKKTIDIVDSYIIGIDNMSVNENMYVTLEELEEINGYLKLNNKELFVSINKNMHNSDLSLLEDILIKLNDLNIKGVLYYDVSILNISKRIDINYDLVWACEHYTTNYNTINYWNSFGVKYTLISGEITIEEILEISKNTKSKLIVPLFGYLPMYVSKRHNVKNYLEYFKLQDISKVNYIENDNNYYPIIDNKVGTYVYSSNILNGIKEVKNLKDVDYILLNGFNIDLDLFIEVIKMYKEVNKLNEEEYDKKINEMFSNVDRGFLYKETISKVKKND